MIENAIPDSWPVQLLVEASDDVGDGGGGLLGPEHVQVVDALEHVVVHRVTLLVSPAQAALEWILYFFVF